MPGAPSPPSSALPGPAVNHLLQGSGKSAGIRTTPHHFTKKTAKSAVTPPHPSPQPNPYPSKDTCPKQELRADPGWWTDTPGCPLPGTRSGQLPRERLLQARIFNQLLPVARLPFLSGHRQGSTPVTTVPCVCAFILWFPSSLPHAPCQTPAGSSNPSGGPGGHCTGAI